MLSLLVSSSQERGRGKEGEFTALPGNRQSKLSNQREKSKINIIKLKSCYQFNYLTKKGTYFNWEQL